MSANTQDQIHLMQLKTNKSESIYMNLCLGLAIVLSPHLNAPL